MRETYGGIELKTRAVHACVCVCVCRQTFLAVTQRSEGELASVVRLSGRPWRPAIMDPEGGKQPIVYEEAKYSAGKTSALHFTLHYNSLSRAPAFVCMCKRAVFKEKTNTQKTQKNKTRLVLKPLATTTVVSLTVETNAARVFDSLNE